MNAKIEAAVRALQGTVIAAELRECADYIESRGDKWTVQGVVEMLRNRAALMEG